MDFLRNSWRKITELGNFAVRSQQPMSIDNDGCLCYQLNGISDFVSNLHKSSLKKLKKKRKNCFSRFLSGGWLCRRRVVIRGQRVAQGQSSGPAVWCAVCKMLNKRYIFVATRGSSSPHPGTDSLGPAMQIEFNAAVNRIWRWFTMLVATQVFVADSFIVDLLSLAVDCFII